MAEDNRKVVIELQNVKRYFQVGEETVKALRGAAWCLVQDLRGRVRHHSGNFRLRQVDAAEPVGLS